MDNKETFFENETRKHQQEVARYLMHIAKLLLGRAMGHDQSKLVGPERPFFVEGTIGLRGLTYGSEEYKAALRKMKPGVKEHYATNRHHPEYFAGYPGRDIESMDLIDLIEMMCDWKAATKRHADGDINKSFEINNSRFKLSEANLLQILKNTAERYLLL